MSTGYRFWFWLVYLIPLKRWAIAVQRWLLERDAPTAPLPRFDTPEELEAYVKRTFVWRADSEGRTFKFWDWPSRPTVTQARLNDTKRIGDGDCDDIALLIGVLLSTMPSVSDVRLLCVGYSNPRAAHVVTVFRRGAHWYLFNGAAGIRILEALDSAPAEVVRQMRKGEPNQRPRWHVFETLNFKRVSK